jgi:hypothetical protein
MTLFPYTTLFRSNCGDETPTGNWEAVTVVSSNKSGSLNGYIFKNNITNIESFPGIEGKGDFMAWGVSSKKSSTITAKNDSITVTMKLVRKDSDSYNAVEEITVTNGKTTTAIQSSMKNVQGLKLYIGNDGALYLRLNDGSDGEPQEAWYSIVNGKVIYHVSQYLGC